MDPIDELMSYQQGDRATNARVLELAAAIRKAALEEAAALVDREGYSHTAGLSQFVANEFERTAEKIRALIPAK